MGSNPRFATSSGSPARSRDRRRGASTPCGRRRSGDVRRARRRSRLREAASSGPTRGERRGRYEVAVRGQADAVARRAERLGKPGSRSQLAGAVGEAEAARVDDALAGISSSGQRSSTIARTSAPVRTRSPAQAWSASRGMNSMNRTTYGFRRARAARPCTSSSVKPLDREGVHLDRAKLRMALGRLEPASTLSSASRRVISENFTVREGVERDVDPGEPEPGRAARRGARGDVPFVVREDPRRPASKASMRTSSGTSRRTAARRPSAYTSSTPIAARIPTSRVISSNESTSAFGSHVSPSWRHAVRAAEVALVRDGHARSDLPAPRVDSGSMA